jgi:translation initiation factor IF-1
MKYLKRFENKPRIKEGDIVKVRLSNSGYFYGTIIEFLNDDFYDVKLDKIEFDVPFHISDIEKLNKKQIEKYKLEKDSEKYNL